MKYVTGTKTLDAQTTVVICQGEMESQAVEELHQAVDPLLGEGGLHLVFDLAAVEYLSSSVLSFLMSRQATVKEKNGKVSLVGASDLVRQVFEMASLDSLFTFHGTLAEAGVVPATPEKGREKGGKKERKAGAKDAGAAAVVEAAPVPRAEEKPPASETVAPISERRARVERTVEKLQPMAEPKSWRDYAVWIGIGVMVAVSGGVSLYLYLYKL
jgi:anti-sigma B factor antagonist